MNNTCKSCGEIMIGNYCYCCGQRKYRPIDRAYLIDEVKTTVHYADRGFLYTVKKLIKNPGKTAREYIDGDRSKHYKPILLVILLNGISAFISYRILGVAELLTKENSQMFSSDYLSFLQKYPSLTILIPLPFYAFMTKLAFKKWGHNYYEHIVMMLYFLSFTAILSIPINFLFYYFNSFTSMMVISYSYMFIGTTILLTWFFIGFYHEKPVKSVVRRMIALVGWQLLFIIIISVLTIAIGILFAFLAAKYGIGESFFEYIKNSKSKPEVFF